MKSLTEKLNELDPERKSKIEDETKRLLYEMKQVIIIRTDINMTSGKRCTQAAHASLTAYIDYALKFPEIENLWYKKSQTKITCKIKSLEELISIYEAAKNQNLPCALITDEGRTCFRGEKTITAAAIGPWHAVNIDLITDHLALL
jgi:PTH2 family peptidyl-tRNA hydrolase